MNTEYIYFDNENGPIYFDNLEELKNIYNDIVEQYQLSEHLNNEEFYKNMNDDGFFIIQLINTEIVLFFINTDKINDIYDELENEDEILKIINKKLNR